MLCSKSSIYKENKGLELLKTAIAKAGYSGKRWRIQAEANDVEKLMSTETVPSQHVVFFGNKVSEDKDTSAMEAAKGCYAFLYFGSLIMTMPTVLLV
ncbi:hypothetical protein Tco_1087236, partial [Tanacetum coccineum]